MKVNSIFICALLLVLFAIAIFPAISSERVFSERIYAETDVLIDPGHGGIDGGAVGASGTLEKEVNLSISKKTYELLRFCGFFCVLSREDDRSLGEGMSKTIREVKNADLRARVDYAQAMQSACLISVHLNAYSDQSCHGAQVFYSPNNTRSESLAKQLQNALKIGLDPQNHRVAKKADKGHYILQNVDRPSVIVECGFLSNPSDERKLNDNIYQQKIAACITAGYFSYLNLR